MYSTYILQCTLPPHSFLVPVIVLTFDYCKAYGMWKHCVITVDLHTYCTSITMMNNDVADSGARHIGSWWWGIRT